MDSDDFSDNMDSDDYSDNSMDSDDESTSENLLFDDIMEDTSNNMDEDTMETDDYLDISLENRESPRPNSIKPYSFEPEAKPGESDENYMECEIVERDSLSNWCSCGFCANMPSMVEHVCCKEIPQIQAILKEENIHCLTQHPSFNAVSLDPVVLDIAWFHYKQQYREAAYEGPTHKKRRHCAYRNLVMWVWHRLGKDIRVVLPSCAVNVIRTHFSPPGNKEDWVFTGYLPSPISFYKL